MLDRLFRPLPITNQHTLFLSYYLALQKLLVRRRKHQGATTSVLNVDCEVRRDRVSLGMRLH